jgi:hypothetical protein
VQEAAQVVVLILCLVACGICRPDLLIRMRRRITGADWVPQRRSLVSMKIQEIAGANAGKMVLLSSRPDDDGGGDGGGGVG